MTDKILSLLGLCRRAGKLAIGAEPSIESMQKHKSVLILYAEDFSHNSLKPVLEQVKQSNVNAFDIHRSKDELSHSLGKLCGVLSVEDRGFADKLVGLIQDEQRGELYDKI